MRDAFDTPITTLPDVPGFFPGVVQENGGTIRHIAGLANEIAVAGAEGAADAICRKQTADAQDPKAVRARMVPIRSLAMPRTKHAGLPSRKRGNPPQ